MIVFQQIGKNPIEMVGVITLLDALKSGSSSLTELCMDVCLNRYYISICHQHPSICSSAYSSIHPFIHLPTHQFIHPSIHSFICLLIHPSIHLFIHPSIHPFIHLSIHSSIHPSILGYNSKSGNC